MADNTDFRIPVDQVVVDPEFNVREEYGDNDDCDLEQSMKLMGININPIGVFLNKRKYQLLFGERRLRIAQKLDLPEVRCLLYEPKDAYERFLLMFHENLGRKELTWQEEAKALKIWRDFESKQGGTLEQMMEKEAKRRDISIRSVWRLFEAAQAITEFPQLQDEPSRSAALLKYSKLKGLEDDKKKEVREGKVTVDKVLKTEKKKEKTKSLDGNEAVITELKKEVEHYKGLAEGKDQLQMTPKEMVDQIPQEERIELGIWLEDEVRKFVGDARSCSGFGAFDPSSEEQTCKECKKETPETYERCHWWNARIGKKGDKSKG